MNDIEVSYAPSTLWSVAGGTPDRTTRIPSWLSAETAAEAMNGPAEQGEACARAVLSANPDDPQARLLLSATLMRQNRWEEARGILEHLSQTQPQMESVWPRLGKVMVRAGERTRAIVAFERALDLEIRGREAWYALGSLLPLPVGQAAKDFEDSGKQARDPIERPGSLSCPGPDLHSDDPVSLKLRADPQILESRWLEAKRLLARSLEVAPDYAPARFRYATMLFAHGEFDETVPQIEQLLGSGCDMPLLRAARAVALVHKSDYSGAVASFDTFIANCDSFPGLWHEYGRALRWAGDRRMSTAFRKATEILPCFFSAWYALATVKSFRWDQTLVGQVRAQLARPDLAIEDRALMHFVLGKALEDLGNYAEAFENFRASKSTIRRVADYSPKASQRAWHRTRLLFTPAFLRKHAGAGIATAGPIFIVGMPRAGSTLVEQIISAHSQVEGLGELTVLPGLVDRLYTRAGGPQHWPLLLQRLKPADFRALGEEYLRTAGGLRKTDAPFFTDKQPNNFQLTGLIRLMLPNAKIVDVRRHPLDCGFSCFKHHFPRGHRFACDLGDIGRRYVDYVQLMAHFDEVMPGKVHRLIYERLIENFEAEVRRLLEYAGLPFEPGCLQFFENRRTVITLSYEQVFMPLYQSGIGHWQYYESWLDPLKDALGCVLDAYPDVPKFFPEVHATSKAPRSLGESGGRFRNMRGVRQRPFLNVLGASPA